jgi:hypothetical protein
MQRGIYLKYRQIANIRSVESLQLCVRLSATFLRRNACFRLTHQIKGVGKEVRPAEIARFQGKNHLAFLGADSA